MADRANGDGASNRPVLSIDFETRSTIDLNKVGVYRYATHPDTDIWYMAYAIGDEEPEIWQPEYVDSGTDQWGGEWETRGINKLPERVREHILAGGEVRAWNANFERTLWREIMVKRYGAPPIPLEQWHDTAAEAAAMALPRALEDAALVLGVGEQKDMVGNGVMKRMARPREILDDGTIVWWNEDGCRLLAERKGWSQRKLEQELADVWKKHEILKRYVKQDVRTERAIVPALHRLPALEREVYLLDQRINDRGIRIDRELVLAAQAIADEGIRRANVAISEMTGGAVSKITNHTELRDWLALQGVATDSVSKAAVKEMLGRPWVTSTDESREREKRVRDALELRADAGRSSVAKLASMLAVANDDDRARGLLFYHGASTGRWSGKLIQPQNFPRGEIKNIEQYIPLVLARDYDVLDVIAPPIVVISSMLRSMITAAPGHELIAADYSAIEARVLNWLAGQDDVIENFRRYDRASKAEKPKYDPYRHMAVKMGRGRAPELVTKEDRQAGKAAELGCGYGMGWRKFITAAWDVYQVRVSEEEAQNAVNIYRESHHAVQQLWWDTNDACMRAVEKPGEVQVFGGQRNLKALKAGAYLYIILPSGRPLVYAKPKIVMLPPPWGGEARPQLEVSGVDPFTRKWGRIRLYGGLLVENIVQAVSRDLIAEGMLRAEQRGYTPVLSVHDEAVSEVPEGFGSVEEFVKILEELPDWARGCPVAAEGWRGFRYRK